MSDEQKVEALIERLQRIEKKRKVQTYFRLFSIVAIILLVLYTYYGVKSKWSNFDKEEFGKVLADKTQKHFEPELKELTKKTQEELYPALQEEVKKQLNERLPRVKEDLLRIGVVNKERLSKQLSKLTVELLQESVDELKTEFPDEDIEKILANLHLTSEKLTLHLSNKFFVVQEGFDAEKTALIDAITKLEANPASSQLTIEEAEKQFAAAFLDLVKYDLIPEEGVKPITVQGGK